MTVDMLLVAPSPCSIGISRHPEVMFIELNSPDIHFYQSSPDVVCFHIQKTGLFFYVDSILPSISLRCVHLFSFYSAY